MSQCIASDVIAQLGELHHGRKRIQPASRDIRTFYDRAKEVLKFPLLRFSDAEGLVIAEGCSEAIASSSYMCYACAIMPDHVHLLIRKHRDLAEEMIENLQAASFRRVIELRQRHHDHPVWGGPVWKVYEDSVEDMRRTVKYVERNPIEARMPARHWSFLTPFDDWPLHKRCNR